MEENTCEMAGCVIEMEFQVEEEEDDVNYEYGDGKLRKR